MAQFYNLLQGSIIYFKDVKNGCCIAPALGFMSRLTTYQGDWLLVSPEDESRHLQLFTENISRFLDT